MAWFSKKEIFFIAAAAAGVFLFGYILPVLGIESFGQTSIGVIVSPVAVAPGGKITVTAVAEDPVDIISVCLYYNDVWDCEAVAGIQTTYTISRTFTAPTMGGTYSVLGLATGSYGNDSMYSGFNVVDTTPLSPPTTTFSGASCCSANSSNNPGCNELA